MRSLIESTMDRASCRSVILSPIRELQLGLRTFGKFASDEETRQIMQKARVPYRFS